MDEIADRVISRLGASLSVSGQNLSILASDGSTLSTVQTQSGVTGIKGDSETDYRTGNVNLTPANVGAAAASHTHLYAGSSTAGGDATNALKLGGAVASESNTGSTIVKRNASGHIYGQNFNGASASENINSYSGALPAFFDTNGWLRKTTLAYMLTAIGAYSSSAGTALANRVTALETTVGKLTATITDTLSNTANATTYYYRIDYYTSLTVRASITYGNFYVYGHTGSNCTGTMTTLGSALTTGTWTYNITNYKSIRILQQVTSGTTQVVYVTMT